jgi:hypothetical protein
MKATNRGTLIYVLKQMKNEEQFRSFNSSTTIGTAAYFQGQ